MLFGMPHLFDVGSHAKLRDLFAKYELGNEKGTCTRSRARDRHTYYSQTKILVKIEEKSPASIYICIQAMYNINIDYHRVIASIMVYIIIFNFPQQHCLTMQFNTFSHGARSRQGGPWAENSFAALKIHAYIPVARCRPDRIFTILYTCKEILYIDVLLVPLLAHTQNN